MFLDLANGSYPTPATQIDCDRTVNLYPETIAADGGTPGKRAALIRSPGSALLQTLSDSGGRGAFALNGRMFAVAGGSFYELPTKSTSILRGTIPKTSTPVQLASTPTQIMLLADGLGFVFTLATNAFAQITATGFPTGAVSLTAIDTYFIVLKANSNQFQVSGLLDGFTWAASMFGSSQQPDNGVAIAESQNYLWILGLESVVVYQDTAGATFPFQRVEGSQIAIGLAAALSVVKLDNTLFFLGRSGRGGVMLYRFDGFLPTRVSNYAMEAAMQRYGTVSDATAYAYEERGHLFYRCDFPSANGGAGATWCYDVGEKRVSERGAWNAGTLTYSAQRGRYHAFCFGSHLTLDYSSGAVYEQSLAYGDEAGAPLRWLRSLPDDQSLRSGQKWIFYNGLELMATKGDGLASAAAGSSTANMLMNAQGLVVNAYNNVAGRGDYFHEASGTSEGQFLYTLGMFDAYRATGNPAALANAQLALSNVLAVLYRGAVIPDTVDATHIFAPHWLFAVKSAFATSQIWYTDTFSFTAGVAHIPDTRGPVRTIFQAMSVGAVLLWPNPYSPLTSGTAYAIASSVYNSGTQQTDVTLSSSFTGTLTVIYSTQSGDVITPGTPYEAWPDWRVLAAGEIDSACDTYNWAYRMFLAASSAIGGTWPAAAAATLQQAAIVYDVNDARDWLKLSYTSSAFSDGSRFQFNSRATAATFARDTSGNVVISIVAGAGETQYGNASINDAYNSGDSTTVAIGASAAVSVTLYIDPTSTYVPANRYSKTVALNGSGLQSFTFTATDFRNPGGAAIPAGSTVYTFGVSDTSALAHTLTLGRVRQLPHKAIAYYPGALPFTANFLGQPSQLIDWRGPAYIGYQSPWMWKRIGNETAVANSVQMIADAQTAWHTQTGQADSGPFAPVYYFARQDAATYGTPNTFGWNGPDPNTKWGGYAYRPLAEVAELVRVCTGAESYYSKAVSIADTFLAYVDAHWSTATAGPPTDYPAGGAGQVNYPEPHFVALIVRAALLMDQTKRPAQTGAMNATYSSLLSKALAFWAYWWQPSGVMAGTFSSDTVNQTWFGFWHGEIMRTLALVSTWATANGQTATVTQVQTWLNGMISFAGASVLAQGTPTANLRWSDDGGKTWGKSHAVSLGQLGQNQVRSRWPMNNRSRNRAWELSGSDPVPEFAILGAEVLARKGSS